MRFLKIKGVVCVEDLTFERNRMLNELLKKDPSNAFVKKLIKKLKQKIGYDKKVYESKSEQGSILRFDIIELIELIPHSLLITMPIKSFDAKTKETEILEEEIFSGLVLKSDENLALLVLKSPVMGVYLITKVEDKFLIPAYLNQSDYGLKKIELSDAQYYEYFDTIVCSLLWRLTQEE